MASQEQDSESQSEVQNTEQSLIRLVEFDAKSLIRERELGSKFSFEDIVEPAKRLQGIFAKLFLEALKQFPDKELGQIRQQADNVYNLFQQVIEFDPEDADASSRRESLINKVDGQYQPVFSVIYPFISFAVARTVDFDQVAADGRAAVQSVRDEANKVMEELKDTSSEAERVLHEVRDAAAEQGVTQQAKYFSGQADTHERHAGSWLIASILSAALVVGYAVLTLFFSRIDFLEASSIEEAIQLTASKILVFVVLAFLLLQCVKNYGAHRHNAVSNRHRQNALMTYTTLADAGSTSEARDTVLQHAAAAVYAPGDTGYLKSEERGYGGNPVVGFSPRSIVGNVSSGDSV